MLRTLCFLLALSGTTPLLADPGPGNDASDIQATLRTYYFEAARAGNTAMLDEFIHAGYDLNTADEKGYTALILAAYHGHREAVEQLLHAGADACAQDQRGNTALMGAVFKGEVRIAKRLLDTRCSPDQRNGSGQTAAMYAALFQRKDLLDALANKGADLSAEDASGNNAHSLARGDIRTGWPQVPR
ncbi:ankyrin repeat domain-containing protein [Pseudomonas syringae]|nr:ankyrin repeat domain-containing protein [Pseudomonas syringae]MBD8573926.1 ankyrin repeat domain-containing protein [Pseudomonas syringae]MBD8791329.1 ankyrin repeat domain-containing protein [Pseudomonas syringae]MBD8801537.1 ankyrin repeat domain-containing protein [Pseudomonas syringae]MBD8810186.1 ankyrin repeat domain-containing protein [Pseudomonas syringae]